MAEGQYSGVRANYIYKSDVDANFLITLDKTLGDIPQCGLTAATTQNAAGLGDIPKLLKPRYVLWQGEVGGRVVRKRLICAPDAPAYESASSVAFEIDGSTNGGTTGRVGEKLTFRKLAVVAAPEE